MNWLQHKKVVFAGCARDSAQHLPAVFANIEGIAALFGKSAFIFVENGSLDSTRGDLEAWCRSWPNSGVISPDDRAAGSNLRSLRIAGARNAYLAHIRSLFADFDYLVVMDMDDANTLPLALDGFARAVAFLEADGQRAGVFANALGIYYDMWALRHPALCPGDVWEEVCDFALNHGVDDRAAFAATLGRRIFSLKQNAAPLEVDSAFGGLGLYRLRAVLENPQAFIGLRRKQLSPALAARLGFADASGAVGWQTCEHVPFHAGLRQAGGRLFVLPWLINRRADREGFEPSGWRSLLLDIRS
jgi:hypothetical protein